MKSNELNKLYDELSNILEDRIETEIERILNFLSIEKDNKELYYAKRLGMDTNIFRLNDFLRKVGELS